MSHTVTIKAQFKDESAILAAAKELGLPVPVRGNAKLYDGVTTKNTLNLRLPGWTFPVAINTQTGEAQFDNYKGTWGEQKQLDRFTQTYVIHKATMAAKAKGYTVARQPQKNGSVHLVVTGF